MKKESEPNCPSVADWIKKMWFMRPDNLVHELATMAALHK